MSASCSPQDGSNIMDDVPLSLGLADLRMTDQPDSIGRWIEGKGSGSFSVENTNGHRN